MKRIGVMVGVKAKDSDKKELALELISFLKDRSIEVCCLQTVAEWLGLDSAHADALIFIVPVEPARLRPDPAANTAGRAC